VIELTPEMKAAVKKRMGVPDGHEMDPWMGSAIEDVLAIVERDLTVWVTFDRDEAKTLAVATSADAGKRAAQADSDDRTLRWEERRDGRFVDTGWVYEVRPFKLGGTT
jgi:hypothetical protein